MSGLHFHPLRVASVMADTADSCIVGFEPADGDAARWQFLPGQHLTLRAVIDGQEQRRSYSLCAVPGQALRVGVRRVPGGVFSGWIHERLRPGDRIEAMQPQGAFGHALARAPRHVLAVAGGSGITPLISVLESHLAAGPGTRATLVYANRTLASTMLREALGDLKNRYLPRLAVFMCFTRELVDAPLAAGRLDADKLARVLRLVGGAGSVDEAFVCGPHAMNDEIEAALLAAGLGPEQVHVERFGIPPLAGGDEPLAAAAATAGFGDGRPGDAAQARITVVRDGLTRELDYHASDGSLLAAATRAGLDLPYSCRSGVCATCRARVLEGRVRMDRNFALPPDELDSGFVLSCQAHPLTDRVTISFDER
jgi:ring-1,2-phenylacetyl-CoA epoxidase subunit PaaE